MPEAADVVLVHSPLLGPFSWSLVQTQLEQQKVSVLLPDLRPSITAPSSSPSDFVGLAGRLIAERPASVLVGHSGAGPLLTAIAETAGNVTALVYVDAGLPHPGQSWTEEAPSTLVRHLRRLVDHDGRL